MTHLNIAPRVAIKSFVISSFTKVEKMLTNCSLGRSYSGCSDHNCVFIKAPGPPKGNCRYVLRWSCCKGRPEPNSDMQLQHPADHSQQYVHHIGQYWLSILLMAIFEVTCISFC